LLHSLDWEWQLAYDDSREFVSNGIWLNNTSSLGVLQVVGFALTRFAAMHRLICSYAASLQNALLLQLADIVCSPW